MRLSNKCRPLIISCYIQLKFCASDGGRMNNVVSPTWRAPVGRVAEAEADIEGEGEHVADGC